MLTQARAWPARVWVVGERTGSAALVAQRLWAGTRSAGIRVRFSTSLDTSTPSHATAAIRCSRYTFTERRTMQLIASTDVVNLQVAVASQTNIEVMLHEAVSVGVRTKRAADQRAAHLRRRLPRTARHRRDAPVSR